MSLWPALRFEHILRMSDTMGTYEHAEFDRPRIGHGYCTDDMARVLVVTSRQAQPTEELRRLGELSLRFLCRAQGAGGGYMNRLNRWGRWTDRETVEDCWGRSLWGLGTAAARSDLEWTRRRSIEQFERGARRRSPWVRAMAFAAIGAAEVLAVDPDHPQARALLEDAGNRIPPPTADRSWPWPESRLTYANAVIPEAMIAAGRHLDRPNLLQHGLDLLGWLVDHETLGGHLSPTPVGGAGITDPKPGFDQQPIEVAALADACVRAGAVDGSTAWANGLASAARWFLGDNDGGQVMWDAATGGGFDGLQADGRNANQGTESTLAALATLQHVQRSTAATR
jgi:hypothetical protein